MGCIVEVYSKKNEFVGYFGWKYNKNQEISKRMVIVDSIAYAWLYNDKMTFQMARYIKANHGKYKNYLIRLQWDGRGLNPEDVLNSLPESEVYTGHETTKYDDIKVDCKFTLDNLGHAVLSCKNKNTRYIIREDGEVFSLLKNGEAKLKVQFYCESGGVKNKERRKSGKSGGSVYKCVMLWSNRRFLTHLLVKKYVTGNDSSITNEKGKITNAFYKGAMPVNYLKRCFKA